MFKKRMAALSLSLVCLAGASVAHAADSAVGSWLWSTADELSVITLMADGRYMDAGVFHSSPGVLDTAHTQIEWGTYSWNATTGAINATSLGDLNGNWGLAGDVDGIQYLTVSGNTGTLFQPGCCSGTLTRILSSPSSAIVGTWTDGEYGVNTFLADGRYIAAQVVPGDAAHTGIEWGTYSWDAASGKITATALGDRNGDWGIAGDVDGPQYATISGNVATVFQPGCADCGGIQTRILPVPEPESYAMYLAGLGLLGVMIRRRKARI